MLQLGTAFADVSSPVEVHNVNEAFEVTPAGETVWQYVNPVVHNGILAQGEKSGLDHRGHSWNAVFKIHRYPTDYAGLAGKDLTPLGPIEQPASLAGKTVSGGRINAYNSLLLKRRKQIHETIGKAIEELYAERLEEFFEMLGIPTRLSWYGVTDSSIKKIADRFFSRGTLLGEHKDTGSEQIRQILMDRL